VLFAECAVFVEPGVWGMCCLLNGVCCLLNVLQR